VFSFKGTSYRRKAKISELEKRKRMIEGTIVSQGKYADGKEICEITVYKACSDRLPHEHGKKMPITIYIGKTLYEAGVHETEQGVVWISSVLHAKLVDALVDIGSRKGDRIKITDSNDGILSLQR
jgi:hypothetical protein